ncbi:glycosyltransferase WbuB [Lautropia dentalis]|uniref:Glycosyltransferase WbuB n=1 Tax=Lautropia dentalis TaxID=2490857 RepID=A0A3R8MSC3_9BURK|nr:glycosyltransferase family 4 protein [Lautropia dentalis]RRN43985.1 glycosyltransferase WbuB [Lautropia dentalis]
MASPKLNILFLTDNFPPERNVPAMRTWEHVSRWVKDGHRVTIITTAPNFPQGKPLAGYTNRWYMKEDMGGVTVIRVKSYIAANEGFLKRILDYVSFMVTGGIVAMFQKRPDILITTSPQFFCAVAGWVVSRLRRLPWIFELRDLWPASIVAVGAMKEGIAIKTLYWMEMSMYRAADRVIAVTKGLKQDLVDRGIPSDKIVVVRNGADTNRFTPRPKDATFVEKFGLQGKFVVGYYGTIGMGAGVQTAVDAGRVLRDRGRDDIVIMLAGAGAEYDEVEKSIQEQGLANVKLLPPFDQADMPAVWSLLDAAIVMMKDRPLFRATISSKTFEALAMGMPVIMSLPAGEATGLVDEYGFGINVLPENPEDMANAIQKLADDPALTKALGQKALEASRDFSRERSAGLVMDVVQDVMAERRPGDDRVGPGVAPS